MVRKSFLKEDILDFPGGVVVKNLPANAEDTGLIPCRSGKILRAAEQRSPCATTTEFAF